MSLQGGFALSVLRPYVGETRSVLILGRLRLQNVRAQFNLSLAHSKLLLEELRGNAPSLWLALVKSGTSPFFATFGTEHLLLVWQTSICTLFCGEHQDDAPWRVFRHIILYMNSPRLLVLVSLNVAFCHILENTWILSELLVLGANNLN